MISYINSFNAKRNTSFRAKPIASENVRWISDIGKNPKVKRILIVPHESPDDDCTRAAEYFYNLFKNMGKKVAIFINPPETKGLNFNHKKYRIYKSTKRPDKVVVVDLNSSEKLSPEVKSILKEIKSEDIFCVDHHTKSEKTIEGNLYIDTSAKSCCAMCYRIAQARGKKLSKSDLKALYCGILSDYQKSKLVKFKNNKLIKLSALDKDINAKEVLEQIEKQISEEDKIRIYKHLDILSNLTQEEQAFRKTLFSEVQITPNGKLAYVVINPNDKQWQRLGMHNTRTSAILRDLRVRLINGVQTDKIFSEGQRKLFKNLKGAIVFYRDAQRSDSKYRFSMHGKVDYAERIVNYVKKINPAVEGGGHPDREGGGIKSLSENKIKELVNNFLTAAKHVN